MRIGTTVRTECGKGCIAQSFPATAHERIMGCRDMVVVHCDNGQNLITPRDKVRVLATLVRKHSRCESPASYAPVAFRREWNGMMLAESENVFHGCDRA